MHQFASRAVPMLLSHAAQMQCFFRRFDPEALSDDETLTGLIDFCVHAVVAQPEVELRS
jgi:hypothetical protein